MKILTSGVKGELNKNGTSFLWGSNTVKILTSGAKGDLQYNEPSFPWGSKK